MRTKLTRQEVKNANYAAATTADAALAIARGRIWTATGNYIEYANTETALADAEAELRKALAQVQAIRDAIAGGE
jgi:hypothetical protein